MRSARRNCFKSPADPFKRKAQHVVRLRPRGIDVPGSFEHGNSALCIEACEHYGAEIQVSGEIVWIFSAGDVA
jgi:hypothetical protein